MDNTTYDYSGLTGPLKYRLTNDYMFKAFLQKNEKALRGLLCALLRLYTGWISRGAVSGILFREQKKWTYL